MTNRFQIKYSKTDSTNVAVSTEHKALAGYQKCVTMATVHAGLDVEVLHTATILDTGKHFARTVRTCLSKSPGIKVIKTLPEGLATFCLW